MSDTKHLFPQFAFYDRTGIQAFLEKQAAMGWLLDKIGPYSWHFHRDYPRKLHFAVTYFPKADIYDPEPGEEEQTFREFCAHGGWTLAASSAQMQIFYSESENPTPIETDPVIEVENIHKSMKKGMLTSYWLLLATGILQLLLQWFSIRKDPVEFCSSNISLFMIVFWIVLLILDIGRLVNYYRWRKRARLAAEEDGVFVETRGYGGLESTICILLMVVLLGILITMENRYMAVVLGLGMVTTLVVIALMEAFRRKLKREGYDAKTSKKATAIACVVLAIAVMGVVNALIVPVINNTSWEDEAAVEAALPLKIQDLLGDGEYNTLVLTDQESILLGYHRIYQVNEGITTSPNLQYELMEVKAPVLYERCLAEMMDYPSRNPGAEYQQIDPAPWGAEQAWQLFNGEELRRWYVLCYEDAILELIPSWDITREQMEKVGEIFG